MIREVVVMGRGKHTGAEVKYRREICTVARWMYRQGFIVASEGNLSVRLEADRILLTPAGSCKGRLVPNDLIITDLDGAVVCGTRRPSSELQMHLLFYRLRSDVRAVCHAHPPTATGFAAAGRALEETVLPEVVTALGKIPLAPYGTPGTWELSARIKSLVPHYDAILLENHGVVTCGSDLVTAYRHMETVEHFARVMLTAESLGGARLLTHAEVQKLGAFPRSIQNLVPQRPIRVVAAANGRNRFGITQREFDPLGTESGAGHLKRRRGKSA